VGGELEGHWKEGGVHGYMVYMYMCTLVHIGLYKLYTY